MIERGNVFCIDGVVELHGMRVGMVVQVFEDVVLPGGVRSKMVKCLEVV